MRPACHGRTGAGAAALFEKGPCEDCCTVKRPAAFFVVTALFEVSVKLRAAQLKLLLGHEAPGAAAPCQLGQQPTPAAACYLLGFTLWSPPHQIT